MGRRPGKGCAMSIYLIEVAYTSNAWSAMISNPQNRAQVVQMVVENLGGKLNAFWMAFGDYDVIGIIEMPDNVSAAAFSMAISGGGACRAVKTTPLLSIEDGLAAMKKGVMWIQAGRRRPITRI